MTISWLLPEPLDAATGAALESVPSPLRPVLARRGFTDMDSVTRFLDPSSAPVHDPFRLPNMIGAVDLIQAAIADRRQIVIYADYDADGVTGAALLVDWLGRAGGSVEWYVPDRFEEGYGLNAAAVDRLVSGRSPLLLTVDCGVRGVGEVALANDLGADVIITDHHHPGPELPEAAVIINPRLDNSDYPFESLAGVGLAYKLAHALAISQEDAEPTDLLDLVAIGTIADLAPLVDENRGLVARGLQTIGGGARPGVAALLAMAGVTPSRVSAEDVGFRIGPRLNAAGRMAHAKDAVELLLSADLADAGRRAAVLDRQNSDRQAETQQVVDIAIELVEQGDPTAPVLMVVDPGFHEGVVGLAASRLAERYNRPVLVGAEADGQIRGSARSIPGFHITDALQAAADDLLAFGGHAAAAGFTLAADRAVSLLSALRSRAEDDFPGGMPGRQIQPESLVSLAEMTTEILEWMDKMAPFGIGNPAPLYAALSARLTSARAVGREGKHLKVSFKDSGRPFDGIAFRQGERARQLGQLVDVAFHYEWNEFRGVRSPQLNITAIRPAAKPG